MRDQALSDVLKVWLYAAASVMLGAWASPLLYNAGKALSEVSSVKQTNGPVEWLADLCRAAAFPRFFEASILLAAVVLFIPFVEWLHGGRAADGSAKRPWHLRLPSGARKLEVGQRLVKNDSAVRHVLRGFLVVTVLFLLIGGVLMIAGIFEWRSPAEGYLKLLLRTSVIALGMAALQEVLFRGIALGIFLRAMRPAAALAVSAVFFALVHFLKPPLGLNVADPDASGIGFELLGKILSEFSDPRMLLGNFVPLLALGGVLAFARWRTASLWLPIGLHSGWIFVNGIMAAVTVASTQPNSMMWVIAGASLRQGLVPLGGILLAGVLIDYLTSTDSHAPESAT